MVLLHVLPHLAHHILGVLEAVGGDPVGEVLVPPQRDLLDLCRAWDEYFLLPGRSPHLRLHEEGEQIVAEFAGERIPFLRRDVLVLPLRNITIEEMAGLLCARLVEEIDRARGATIDEAAVKVSSGPGQVATACWRRGA